MQTFIIIVVALGVLYCLFNWVFGDPFRSMVIAAVLLFGGAMLFEDTPTKSASTAPHAESAASEPVATDPDLAFAEKWWIDAQQWLRDNTPKK